MSRLSRLFFCFFSLFLASCSSHDKDQYVGYVEHRYVYLSSNQSGTIGKIFVKKGQAVSKGQVLFALSTDFLEKRRQLEESLLVEKQKLLAHLVAEKGKVNWSNVLAVKNRNVQRVRDSYERSKVLYSSGIINQSALNIAKNKLDSEVKQLEEAHAAYNENNLISRLDEMTSLRYSIKLTKENILKIKDEISKMQFAAPMSGVIRKIYKHAGDTVSPKDYVISLLSPDNRVLSFFLPQQRLKNIKLGGKIGFSCQSCGANMKATIIYIADNVQGKGADNVMHLVEATIDSSDKNLKMGETVWVRID